MFGKSLQAIQRRSLETQLKEQRAYLEALRSAVQERDALDALKDEISVNNAEIEKLTKGLGIKA